MRVSAIPSLVRDYHPSVGRHLQSAHLGHHAAQFHGHSSDHRLLPLRDVHVDDLRRCLGSGHIASFSQCKELHVAILGK